MTYIYEKFVKRVKKLIECPEFLLRTGGIIIKEPIKEGLLGELSVFLLLTEF